MKSKFKLVLTILVMGGCWSVVYLVPYLQYTWYDPFKEFIGGTNTKLGLLITIYGFGNVLEHLSEDGYRIDSTTRQFMFCRYFERRIRYFIPSTSYIRICNFDVDRFCVCKLVLELSGTYQDYKKFS